MIHFNSVQDDKFTKTKETLAIKSKTFTHLVYSTQSNAPFYEFHFSEHIYIFQRLAVVPDAYI